MFVSKDARASNVTCRVDELLHILSVFPDVTRVVTLSKRHVPKLTGFS